MELYKIHCFFAKKIKNNVLCNLYLILVFKSSFSVVKNITKGKRQTQISCFIYSDKQDNHYVMNICLSVIRKVAAR